MVLLAATTHRDLINDLNPSVLVDKKFMDEVDIKYFDVEKKKISFYDDVVIKEGTLSDYKKLNKFHYKNMSTNFPYTKIIVAKYNNELVGVAVHSPPFLQTKGRTIKFEGKYSVMKKEVVREINKLFIRGARYVISPKYRACGLGQKLVTGSLPFIKEKKYLEVIAVMGKYNPVFEKAGMEKIEITKETDVPTIKLTNWMKEKGLRLEEIHNFKYFKEFINGLNNDDKELLVRLTGKVLHHPKIGLSSNSGRRAEVVKQEKRYAKISFEEVYDELLCYIPKLFSGITLYYIIKNPYWKENGGQQHL